MNAYIYPSKTRPEHVTASDIRTARKMLALGGGLHDAATVIGATASALDRALWSNIGSAAR